MEFLDSLLTEEKVTFYVISGHLVPGSALIDAICLKSTIKASHWEQGRSSGMGDADYRPKEHDAPLADWWKITGWDNGSFIWKPTEKNTLKEWERYVSIKTRFTYTSLLNPQNRLY